MKSQKAFRLLTAAVMITLCLLTVTSIWIVIEIPRQAEITFGPASKNLNFIQQTELSARLLLEKDRLQKSAGADGLSQTFKIKTAETAFSITNRLEEAGLVKNARALREYLIYTGMDTTIQAGEYALDPGMTPLEIASAIQDSTPLEVIYTILAGWRLEEIARSLPTSGLEFTPENFLFAASTPSSNLWVSAYLPPGATLEGFLFPDQYRFNRKISVEAFLDTALQNFDVKVSQDLRGDFEKLGLSLFQAVTLASIVEKEAVLEEEMPVIASVFFNRLNIGMKLDTDPTVQYALGYDEHKKTWWKNPLSLEDLQVNSPYNTYQNTGLPPGPICNPGLMALKAVGNPAQTSYLYFRSACDGSGRHEFSETFAQHQKKACP